MKQLFLILILLLPAFLSFSQKGNKTKIQKTLRTISSKELMEYVSELSSDQYKGRLSGSPEYIKAAQWVAEKFTEWGIKPALNDSFFQYFDNPYTDVFVPGKVIWHGEIGSGLNRVLKFPEEFLPGSNSSSGAVTCEMVYVGYGITAPELQWDDYAKVDVQSKIVVMESGLPYSKNDSTLAKWTPYAYHRYKFENARNHGAFGLLYVSRIANPNTSYQRGFIYAHVDASFANEIFTTAGKNYTDVKKSMVDNLKPASFYSGQKVTISMHTKNHPEGKACNVVGMIEGSDPVLKNEAIIVGGHLDGQGFLGELFPGALDNASGVADIMGAAKALAGSKIKPKRSVLFVLFGGEECGLWGSETYVANPVFPVEKTICMINLDMVGNGTGFKLTNGLTYPDIYKYFAEANKKWLHRNFETSELRKNYGRPRSDESNFERAGYKTFSLYTSGSVKPVYYHQPQDNADALTPDIMEDAAKLLYLGILGLANEENY